MTQQGLYHKYTIIKRKTGEEIKRPSFVLLPESDPHARAALRAYAASVESDNAVLAADLRSWMDSLSPEPATIARGELHKCIREARKAKGLRQEDVAVALGVVRTTYVAIEAGQRMLRPDELDKLSELFGVPVDELLTASVYQQPTPTGEAQFTQISGDEALLLSCLRAGEFRDALRLFSRMIGGDPE